MERDVSTGFFPKTIRQSAMTQFARENKAEDPLKELNYTEGTPYLIRIIK